jgi:hypothetical protein
LVVVLLAWLTVGTTTAHAESAPITVDVKLDLKADGVLAVTTTTTVPDGSNAVGRVPLQVPVEANRTQHFGVSDISTTGGASASVQGDALVISAPAGSSTVTYSVRGSVADGPGLQQFTWVLAAGWSAPIEKLSGTFTSPSAKPDSPICAYGQIGVRRLCSLTQTDLNGSVSFRNDNLAPADVAVFSVLLPTGTAAATAQFTPTVTASETAPASDTTGLIAVLAAAVVALVLVALAWLRRRADQNAVTAGATVQLLAPHDGGVAFASPDGVLPGQIGTATTGHPRPSDFGATILDLAVRNYLWLAERQRSSGAMDFQISRRAPLGRETTVFERAVVEAILPDDRESVSAYELTQSSRPIDLSAAKTALTASATGWRRSRRVELAGYVVLGLGAAAAVVLALLGTGALWGVAVAVLGGGVAAAGRLLPDRTTQGSRLALAVGGMRRYLAVTNPDSISPAARPVLFARAIPYAHAFGDLHNWLDRWGGAGPVDWYRAAGDRPLPAGLPTLAALLDGVAAQSQAGQSG